MNNTERLQRIMAIYCPVEYWNISMTDTIVDRYVAKEFKRNFCRDIIRVWPKLNIKYFQNEMFGKIKTGNDIINLIKTIANV